MLSTYLGFGLLSLVDLFNGVGSVEDSSNVGDAAGSIDEVLDGPLAYYLSKLHMVFYSTLP